MKTVPILFSFDENMLMPAVVCLTSLLENAAEDTFYDIFILHRPGCRLERSALSVLPELYKNCSITFRKVDKDFAGAYEIRGISIETYFRLVAPELIPEYDKILYSDVDVIFREDLSRFYETELGDCYFAGVDNGSALRPDVHVHLKEIGLDYRKGYYYAGNIVINSALMRKDGKIAEFRELGKQSFKQQDMDILNIACNGRIKPLGPSFCLTNFLYGLIVNRREEMEAIYGKAEIEHALRHGIVHYNGPKPWKQECLNMDIWWDDYRKSPAFDEKFCYEFWMSRATQMDNLPLMKRIKLLGRYFMKR